MSKKHFSLSWRLRWSRNQLASNRTSESDSPCWLAYRPVAVTTFLAKFNRYNSNRTRLAWDAERRNDTENQAAAEPWAHFQLPNIELDFVAFMPSPGSNDAVPKHESSFEATLRTQPSLHWRPCRSSLCTLEILCHWVEVNRSAWAESAQHDD